MPALKCPQCAREVPAGARTCPWDGTPINSVAVRPSLWDDKSGNTDTSPSAARSRAETAESAMLLPGRMLGDYEVGELLGSGGMGEVYAGVQPVIGKKVAIKVLKAEVAAEPGNVQRMLSEARAVSSIRHRSIVDIFNFATLPDGRPYLVMEYLDGTALDVLLRQQGSLAPHEVAEYLEEICSALAAAHAQGIIHRDLKPGNVFIVSSGNARTRYVKLLDFGLAKGAQLPGEAKQTRAGMVVGTPDYIAPEQAKGGTVTARTDLYSLGVMAFEMVSGSLPFTAASVLELMMKHVNSPAPRVTSKVDFCPPALDSLIYRLMSKAPEDRPTSAEVVRQELARIRREMREGETQVGATTQPVALAQTVRLPEPAAADTPQATTLPPPSAPRPRASAPRPAAVVADPTRRVAVVAPTARRRGGLGVGLAAVAAVLLGLGGWWLAAWRPPALPQVVELPVPPPPKVTPPPVEPQPPLEPEVPDGPLVRPVKPVRPKERPPKPAIPPAEQSPTRAELFAEIEAKCRRLMDKGHSPKHVKDVRTTFRDQASAANTVEQRKQLLRRMRDAVE